MSDLRFLILFYLGLASLVGFVLSGGSKSKLSPAGWMYRLLVIGFATVQSGFAALFVLARGGSPSLAALVFVPMLALFILIASRRPNRSPV